MARREDDFTEAQHETMGIPEDVDEEHRAISAAQCMIYLEKDETELESVAKSYNTTPEKVEKKLLKVLKSK